MGRPKGSKNKKKVEGVSEISPESPFVISLTLGSETFKGEGKTPLEALEALNPPHKIVTKGILVVSRGLRERRQTLMPVAVKRLFYPNSKIFLAKFLGIGL